ncbi:MAG: hypothetical protein IT326_05080 [Anaerolineae bacterium]|nr:hypothetical protein [Anaerolineae bacterium]
MSDDLEQLSSNIGKWLGHNISNYWVQIGYLGPETNRFGDHVLTYTRGRLWHRTMSGAWREIERGRDFWLFSVPGAFAWARDVLTRLLPADPDLSAEAITLEFDPEYGFVRHLKISAGHRSASNFDFEVRHFGAEAHPSFEEPA